MTSWYASTWAAAAGLGRSGICYIVGDGAALPFCASAFDAVTAFMSLMDVAEPERTLGEVARVLRSGGFVQFSVLHPVISAPIGRWVHDESDVCQARVVGDYFYEGPLTETWTFSAAPAEVRDRYQPFTITYARRTLAGWLSAVLGVGLVIEAIAEPRADEETAATHPQVADTGSPLTSSSCVPGDPATATKRATRGMCAHFRRQAVMHNHAGRLANCEGRRGRRLHPCPHRAGHCGPQLHAHLRPPLQDRKQRPVGGRGVWPPLLPAADLTQPQPPPPARYLTLRVAITRAQRRAPGSTGRGTGDRGGYRRLMITWSGGII